jgi:hypothetical protein
MNKNEVYTKTASRIIKTLAANKRPMTSSELKKDLDVDWNTVRTNLGLLEKSCRVHLSYIGGNRYYGLNGKGKYQDHIKLSDSQYLWLDLFEPDVGMKEHFIRIKQTRRKDLNNWEPVGSITLKKEQVDELISKLSELKETLLNS